MKKQRQELSVLLHPTDYSRVNAAAELTSMAPNDFYALAMHIGTREILRLHEIEDPVTSLNLSSLGTGATAPNSNGHTVNWLSYLIRVWPRPGVPLDPQASNRPSGRMIGPQP